MLPGSLKPEISAGFTVAPEISYSPIVPLPFKTNRSGPDIAMEIGSFKPEIRTGFIAAPEVAYSPIVPSPVVPEGESVTNIVSGRAVSVHINARVRASGTRNPCLHKSFILPPMQIDSDIWPMYYTTDLVQA